MDVLVKRFSVRHNGVRYTAGEIISDIDDDLAEKLVKQSNGGLEMLKSVKKRKEALKPPLNESQNTSPEQPINDPIQLPDPDIGGAAVKGRGK